MPKRVQPPDLGAVGPAALARPSQLGETYRGAARILRRHYTVECVLDWYHCRALLIDRLWAAGHRLREDWYLAKLSPRVIGSYGERVTGGQRDPTRRQIAAQKRVTTALLALPAEGRDLTIDVCCYDAWASRRLPDLRLWLASLAAHYGY